MVIKFPATQSDSEPDFDSYPDREVLFMGVPYPRSKKIEGVWFRRTIEGGYRRFPFQTKVQEIVKEISSVDVSSESRGAVRRTGRYHRKIQCLGAAFTLRISDTPVRPGCLSY